VATKAAEDHYIDPEIWFRTTPVKEGSWWPEWIAWLDTHSGVSVAPPRMGRGLVAYAPLCEAPGSYVLEQ
jgi:polyhydroxyalkanoate synthase